MRKNVSGRRAMVSVPMSGKMGSMRVLVTGFEPFGGDVENASQVTVSELKRQWSHPDVELEIAVLPVEFGAAPLVLDRWIQEFGPHVVICVGEAGRRAYVALERWADRRAEARIPDNAGEQPSCDLDSGPLKLPSRLDVESLVSAISDLGVPAQASDDAGRFVCNAVFRHVLRHFEGAAGFVHIPAVRSHGISRVGSETDTDAAAVTSEITIQQLVTALRVVIEQSVTGLIRPTAW